jgi:hypothetical protein
VSRGVAAALGIWTAVTALWFVFAYGGHTYMCLGPIGINPEACRAANGLPPETDIDRFLAGPGPLVLALVAGWAVILFVSQWRKRQRGGL